MPGAEVRAGGSERDLPRSAEREALVVGAGPVGLVMACELWRHGVGCRIIDAGEGPTPPEESRALGIHARTLEVFDDIGLAERVVRQGRRLQAASAYDRGRRFARFAVDFDALGTPYPFVLSLAQGHTERRLIDRLSELGGAVEWQTRLVDLRQDERGVTATLEKPGGGRQELRTAWLVGCDGVHSTVRGRLGLSFTGSRYEETFLLADVHLRWEFSQDEPRILLVRGGLVAAIPLPEPGRWRLIDATGVGAPDESEAIVARFAALLGEAGMAGARIEHARWTSRFQIHRRAVDRLRAGRCFLAGDAAHVHSPVGGQGMNTGIQDAYNLGWKLAAVLAHAAPEDLLDSYDVERQPIARSVLRGTDWATRLVTLRNPILSAVRDALIGRISRHRWLRQRLTARVSELSVDYRRSRWVAEDARRGSFGRAPRPGDRVPDLAVEDSPQTARRLFDILRGTHHTLLIFEAEKGAGARRQRESAAIADLIQRCAADRLVAYRVIVSASLRQGDVEESAAGLAPLPDPDGRLHRHFGARQACLYAIRPDGYVGYRAAPPDAVRLATYLDRLGLPRTTR